jgi:hypothetical protein
MKTVNLNDELSLIKRKDKSFNAILDEVAEILSKNEGERNLISQKLSEKNSATENNFEFDLLETENIYSLKHIEQLCVDYRLRFLESGYFKNEIPEEAISKIHALEKNHNTNLQGFKIVAPSKAFHLENYDDPLLFAPIGNGYYYLIHQWGDEINPLRKLLVRPLRDIGSFVTFCLLISLVFTWIMPTSKLSNNVPMASLIVFLFTFKSIIAVTAYYFFMLGKNFNTEIWQRKYYNN